MAEGVVLCQFYKEVKVMENSVNIKWGRKEEFKDGPYKTLDWSLHIFRVVVDGREINVPAEWCEPAEPEIEEGRLVWISNKIAIVRFESGKYDFEEVEPVHRRWNELTEEEQNKLGCQCERIFQCPIDIRSVKMIYEDFYKSITGEEHP
jgi:hypothetical protein